MLSDDAPGRDPDNLNDVDDDEGTMRAPTHGNVAEELDTEQGVVIDELPPHSVCCAHRLNNIAQTDAGFLLLDKFKWKVIRTAGRSTTPTINSHFNDFQLPLPGPNEVNAYKTAYTEAYAKAKKIWHGEGSSSKFRDEFGDVFKK